MAIGGMRASPPEGHEMQRSLETLRQRPHLSVSALKMWLSCPRKFRFHYLDKAEPSHRSIALVFGHAWHELIGRVLLLHRRGHKLRKNELRDYFAGGLEREINADGPPVLFEDDEDAPTLVGTAMQMLDAFLATVPLPDNLLHIELPFSLELADPETGEVLPTPLIGAIDAVMGDERRLELWELKSGKRRWAEDAVLYDFQPTTYRMAVRANAGRGTVKPDVHIKLIVTTKSKKPDIQVENLVRTATDESDLMGTAASIHRAVQSGCFHPIRSWMCKQCEFADVCR
ncbi:MAG TPA: PD-(D/E)XK nuclease family protein [Polyangiaceae bacterium]|nr:PD-(D/E)XK nuclease family protein [Polyangiaceae bacterium]